MPRKAVKDILTALAWQTALVLIISGTGKITANTMQSHMARQLFVTERYFQLCLKTRYIRASRAQTFR